MTEAVVVPRTRARLEAAFAVKSERPLAAGIYSVSMLAKMSAGAIARRILSKEPSDFPAFLGLTGNAMADMMLDHAGVPRESREFDLFYQLDDVALSGHPDAITFDDDQKTVTVLECKRHVFPTAESTEQATRQALAYAAIFRMSLMAARGRGEAMATFTYPRWFKTTLKSIDFPTSLADYAFQVEVDIAAAWEPELPPIVPASPELLGEVLQEFYAKAMAVDVSAKAGNPEAADAFDLRQAKERPVQFWAEPPEPVANLLETLADVKKNADSWAAQEEAVRAELRDAMRAANLHKAVGSGISAAWVQTKAVDQDAVWTFATEHGKAKADFEVERVIPEQRVREVDQGAVEAFLGVNGKAMDDFKVKVVRESFTVRAAGKKPAKSKEAQP